MGGQNHQPTNQGSMLHAVPASRALSLGFAEFMHANAHIEDVIVTEKGEFGAAKSQMAMAINRLEQSQLQLSVAKHHVGQLITLMNRPDYYPFNPINVEIHTLVDDLKKAGLLPESAVVDEYSSRMVAGSYDKAFHGYETQIERLDASLINLINLVRDMSESEGLQGYFWMSVETNQRPFRQFYAKALTEWLELTSSFLTTALISTEVHLIGSGMPNLLSNS